MMVMVSAAQRPLEHTAVIVTILMVLPLPVAQRSQSGLGRKWTNHFVSHWIKISGSGWKSFSHCAIIGILTCLLGNTQKGYPVHNYYRDRYINKMECVHIYLFICGFITFRSSDRKVNRNGHMHGAQQIVLHLWRRRWTEVDYQPNSRHFVYCDIL